jgi:DNA helicase II / ATP-dependent DNA helicase PcrA
MLKNAETDNLLQDLTEPQRQAVTHVDGPLLIIAAAGSGKTRVITRRVAYLLANGTPPNSILAITFTNKAAGEMKHRISAISPRPIRDFGKLDQQWPIICTFHSLCLRILKHYATQIGLVPNFTIYDSADQSKLIKQAVKELDLSATHFPPAAIHHAISNAKNRLIDAAGFASQSNDFFGRIVARVYVKYQQLLEANNALDFDDLMLRTAAALRDHRQILSELQERFRYILIDEYQDTNHAQYVIAHALALRRRNLCVVGDPDQSIYAWRGADINNILNFEKDYPDATVVRLEQNYRSTKTILSLADKLISHNVNRKEKRLWTENAEGEKAKVIHTQDEHEEARTITAELKKLAQQGTPWSQMAVFYRINALTRVMEDALRRAEVPYQIARGVEFYNRKEIKDVIAYLRVVANPADEVNLERIVNVPTRGIGDGALQHVQAFAVASGKTLWQALESAGQADGLSTRALSGINQFVRLIDNARSAVHRPVRQILEELVQKSGMEAMLRKEDPDAENELANVNELISSAAEYDEENPEGSLHDYLSRVSLVSDADHAGKDGFVTLMTLHAAKGLEFPVVAIIGLEEGLLPHSRAQNNADELEEERRLFFVGITRAQERLILSKAAYRTIRGLRERTAASQFLTQMPGELMEVVATASTGMDFSAVEPHEPDSDYRVGQKVRHQAFGLGTIREISSAGAHRRAVVDFVRAGQKNLILEYARLEPA